MSRRLIAALALVAVVLVVGAALLVLKPTPPAAPASSTRAKSVPPSRRAEAPPPALPDASLIPAPAPVRRPRTSRPEAPAPAAPVVSAAPTTATLHIESDVPGAQVFIDRTFIGTTPLTAPDVAPGSHRLNVSASGYDGYADTIEVVPGPRDLMVRLKDVRLDARIAVVHKHTFGSCKGTLSATPQGLRYETASAGDAFTVPLDGIASFEVNYLEKNLKLKLKSGRQFNFADPEGNADRLFVFHRDVSAARKKLEGR